jgi:hypothetical protein
VTKIQSALNLLDHANIDCLERQTSLYGRSTADAVLAYKKKRNIINRSYQKQADNIVGKMTMAFLDREMLALESKSRNPCNCGPKGNSQLLIAFSLENQREFSPAPAPGVLPPPPPVYPAAAIRNAPNGIKLAQESIDALTFITTTILTPPELAANPIFKALVTHYRSTERDFVSTARQIKANLESIVKTLRLASAIFVPGIPGDPDGENAYAYSRDPRDGKIYINPSYMKLAKFARGFALVHEAFHFLSSSNQDFCRNPDNDQGKSYRQIPKDLRLRGAYSLSQLVLHLHLGMEKSIDLETDEVADLAP